MILKRLYELALRDGLLDDPAFEAMPVPFVVNISADGDYLGVQERRGVVNVPAKKGPPKSRPDKGREILIPKPHGNTANAGFARYFCDTLARVLPVSQESKSVASRKTFWHQLGQAAEQTHDPALIAVAEFGRRLPGDNDLAERIQHDLEALKPGPGDRCTLAWHPDSGNTILERSSVRDWWRGFYAQFDKGRQESGRRGVCQITGDIGPITPVHTNKIGGLPGGIASGGSLVSNDKPAFESYGLAGAENAGIGFRAADGYTRAMQSLIQQKNRKSRLSVGGNLFLFWTREISDVTDLFAQVLDGSDPALVEHLFRSLQTGRESNLLNENAFYCITVCANSARITVRDYLEAPLGQVKANLARWFDDLCIVDAWGKEKRRLFPLWQLAVATALDSDHVLPSLPAQLMDAALKGYPLGDCVLSACLQRLHAEGSEGFRTERMALIKLFLKRKGINMGETLDTESLSPAYYCGRLMAAFERIQRGALGEVNASVVDRFYGTASTAPGLVFPRLFKSAQQHLSKMHGDKPGMSVNLQKELELLCSSISAFPRLLTLAQQGEFALGFYHQRADYRKGIAAN